MPNILFDKLNMPRLSSALTVEERAKLLKSLSKDQLRIINDTRRYKAITIFANQHISEDNDWELVNYRVSNDYKRDNSVEKLFCECGRELKYQYEVKSKSENITKKLGFTHYQELTNLNPKVANQILMDVNQLNLKIDEILILIDHGFSFPEELYIEYRRYVNQNSLSKTLDSRIETFRKCNLPLLIADYEDVLKIIRLGKQRKRAYDNQLVTIHDSNSNYLKEKKQKIQIQDKNEQNQVSVARYNKPMNKKKTWNIFERENLKKGKTFLMYPNFTIVNLQGQGYINVQTKERVSEYDLFCKVLFVYGVGNTIIARRDDIRMGLQREKYRKIRLSPGVELKEHNVPECAYSVRCFDKNIYVNIDEHTWLNTVTHVTVSNNYLYKKIRNVANMDGFMIAKRFNPQDSLTTIEPKYIGTKNISNRQKPKKIEGKF